MVHPERIKALNDRPVLPGDYVLYWMQSSQRVTQNEALQEAIAQANALGLPVLVGFGLTADYPAANWRHYRFLLEGLQDVAAGLCAHGIAFAVRLGNPPEVAVDLGRRAALAVVDRGYLRLQTEWYRQAAAAMPCPLWQVESNVVVPVAAASDKEEYAARTLRPKLHRRLNEFLQPTAEAWPRVPAGSSLPAGLDLDDLDAIEARLDLDRSVPPSPIFHGGEREAQRRLDEFLVARLEHYDERRNDPAQDGQSHLSPYLHLGQISPIEVARSALQHLGSGAEAFVEELVVRRELAINACVYNANYDSVGGLPDWARKTLAAQAGAPRPYLYTRAEFEAGETHDPYWNAAQREMVLTGKMHGYMRMYWGKKVLEWSPSPDEAFDTLVYLNDRYELDGRDPNGYAGIAWCFGKHDRPWKRREIYGTVRYMSAAGLERKFDIQACVARIARLERELASEKR